MRRSRLIPGGAGVTIGLRTAAGRADLRPVAVWLDRLAGWAAGRYPGLESGPWLTIGVVVALGGAEVTALANGRRDRCRPRDAGRRLKGLVCWRRGTHRLRPWPSRGRWASSGWWWPHAVRPSWGQDYRLVCRGRRWRTPSTCLVVDIAARTGACARSRFPTGLVNGVSGPLDPRVAGEGAAVSDAVLSLRVDGTR